MSSLDSAKAAIAKLDKRTKIMIGGLAVVVVAGGGYLALGSSSSSTSTAISVPIHHVTATPKATTKPAATPTPPSNLPVQTDPERDPFAPLAAESTSAASTATSATVAAATTTTTSTSSTGATSTSPITTPTPTPTPSASHTIELISINGTSADVTYNGAGKTVTAGQTLSTGITVIKISTDSIFVSNGSKAYAIAPGQTVSF